MFPNPLKFSMPKSVHPKDLYFLTACRTPSLYSPTCI